MPLKKQTEKTEVSIAVRRKLKRIAKKTAKLKNMFMWEVIEMWYESWKGGK